MKTISTTLFIAVIAFSANIVISQRRGAGVTDVDGNFYKTIRVKKTEWMADNLRTLHYSNGQAIESNSGIGFYTWLEITNDQGVCPIGWRVPSNKDWDELADYFGGGDVAAIDLKDNWDKSWMVSYQEATNYSGFSAHPHGYLNENGKLNNKGKYAYWWSSEAAEEETAWGREIGFNQDILYKGHASKKDGLSVRCVK
jgi:uncharacterized protein (TIGR02145 family)